MQVQAPSLIRIEQECEGTVGVADVAISVQLA